MAAVVRDSLVIRFSQMAKNSNFYRDKHSKRKTIHMLTRRIAIFAGLGVAFYPLLPALSVSDPDLLAGLDTDHDGSLRLRTLTRMAR